MFNVLELFNKQGNKKIASKVEKSKKSTEVKESKKIENDRFKIVNLDNKVDEFLVWYKNNISHNDFDLTYLKNFIEKMAVWYEIRYPNYIINRLIPFENKKDDYLDVQAKIWPDFCNTKNFINSLSDEEKIFLEKPKYKEFVYWNENSENGLVLSSKGTVLRNCMRNIGSIETDSFVGKNIKEVVKIIRKSGYDVPRKSEFISSIKKYENKVYKKEELLNSVMYRIINRGGEQIGPRRALLFAKEFNRNIDIPMIFGLDNFDPFLKYLINEYLKLGGKIDLVCYKNYFDGFYGIDNTDTITIKELVKKETNAKEEKELHQKLVNILASQIDYEKLRKEDVEQKRLIRKMEKIKKF